MTVNGCCCYIIGLLSTSVIELVWGLTTITFFAKQQECARYHHVHHLQHHLRLWLCRLQLQQHLRLGESLQGQGKKRPPGRQAGPGRPSAKKQIAAMDVNKSRKTHEFFQQHAFSEFNRGVSRHAQALGAIYGSSVPMPNAKAEDKEVSVAVGISHPKPEPARCQNGFTPIWFALGLGPGLGFWEGEFEFSFINVRAMLCQVLFPIPASSWSMTEPFDPYFWVKTTFDRVDCSKVKALGPWGL